VDLSRARLGVRPFVVPTARNPERAAKQTDLMIGPLRVHKLEVYELINRLTAEGQAVVLVSSELPELMGMSDRIAMLHEGTIGGTFRREEATAEKLMAAALGHFSEGHRPS